MKFNTRASLVSSLKVALLNNKLSCSVPYTSTNLEIVVALMKEGYLQAVNVTDASSTKKKKTVINIKFKYHHNCTVLQYVKLISKPGKKEYWSYKHLKNYLLSRCNMKILLSTDKGVISSNQALNEKIGGEILFEFY